MWQIGKIPNQIPNFHSVAIEIELDSALKII